MKELDPGNPWDHFNSAQIPRLQTPSEHRAFSPRIGNACRPCTEPGAGLLPKKPLDYTTGIEEEDKSSSRGGNRSPSCVTASERRAWPPRTTWRARRRTPTRVGTRLPPPLRSPSGCRGLRFGAGGTNPPGASARFVAQLPTTATRSVQVEIQLPGSASRHGRIRHTGNRLPSPTGVRASRRAFILPTAHPILPTRDRLCAGRTLLKGRRGIPAAPWQGHDVFH